MEQGYTELAGTICLSSNKSFFATDLCCFSILACKWNHLNTFLCNIWWSKHDEWVSLYVCIMQLHLLIFVKHIIVSSFVFWYICIQGFYPGYYFFFLVAPVVTMIERGMCLLVPPPLSLALCLFLVLLWLSRTNTNISNSFSLQLLDIVSSQWSFS